MDMFPHTVTLYNISEDSEYHITSNITLLQGVLLDASKGVNVRTSGIEGADAVNLYIPLSILSLFHIPPYGSIHGGNNNNNDSQTQRMFPQMDHIMPDNYLKCH